MVREFWLQTDCKDIQTYEYFASETQQYDDDIHVIEKSAADKLAEVLEYYAAMKYNRCKGEWMPGNPDKAINALKEYRGSE